MTPLIVPIVEGQGEVEAVPILLRRVLHSQTAYSVDVRRPIRVKRNQVVKPGELERAIELAALQPNCRAILILLDADDDCPAVLGPELLLRAQAARPDVPCSVVLAKSEFEAWFVGSFTTGHFLISRNRGMLLSRLRSGVCHERQCTPVSCCSDSPEATVPD
jgi:hypothetical protein